MNLVVGSGPSGVAAAAARLGARKPGRMLGLGRAGAAAGGPGGRYF